MRTWERPRFTKPGGRRRFVYEAFSAHEMKNGVKVGAKHGLPPGPAPANLQMMQHHRPEHSPWLDAFFKSAFIRMLEARAPERIDEIRKLPYGWGLSCEDEDGPDNDFLQYGFALVRAMFEMGAGAVVDVDTGLWFLPDDMTKIPVDSDFSILPFVNVVIEPRPAPIGPYVINTRGLVKFGRPDLVVCRVPQQYLGHAQTLLYTVSNYLAQGAHLEPDESMTLKSSPKIFARPYPQNDPLQVVLNNAGILLMDEGTSGPPGDVTRWLSWWAENSS